jgi:hypothetical protein
VEFARTPSDRAAFVVALDRALQDLNVDYEEHRSRDADMPLPELVAVPLGTFDTVLRQRSRAAGRSQRKLPRLQNDRSLAEALEELVRGQSTATGSV